ncbi:AraC family transcriptional regulator [Methylosinus sp. LW4]|nr:AraC family transcriptional regulator [Methylosinus sp. LW4]
MTDVLSDIFDTIRLRATLYFRTDYSPPWAITVPSYARAARFHLVIQGRCHVALASGLTVDLGPGDLVLIARGQEHTLADSPGRRPSPLETVVKESGYDGNGVFVVGSGNANASTKMVCGHFGFTEGADHPLLRALPEVIVLTPADRARHVLLDETLRLVARRAFTDGLGSSAAISRLCEVFFIESVRASIEQCPELARILEAMTDPQIGRALELLHKDPARAWTVDGLATEVGMSRSRFADRFAELMKQGPIAYLGEWRLQKALARLSNADISVKEVAREIGYRSPAAFTRAFGQRFGAPPTRYQSGEA